MSRCCRNYRRNQREIGRHKLRLLGVREPCSWPCGTPGRGRLGHAAAKRVFAQVWRTYFLDPRTEPAPSRAWLEGVSAQASRATEKTLLAADRNALATGDSLNMPVAVAYGDHDIFGSGAELVRARFPAARQITFTSCGHVPWLQVPDQFDPVFLGYFGRNGS